MKKLILILSILASCSQLNAQKIKIDSKGNYVAVRADKNADSSKATNTGKLYTDTKGNSYAVFISAKGKLFVNRISKTGNSYKQYLKL